MAIDLSISLGTIIAIVTLIIIVTVEIKRDKDYKKALFNSLFDEMRHNINMSDIFSIEATDSFIKDICHELERLYGVGSQERNKVYPNPSGDITLLPNSTDGRVFFQNFYPNTLIAQTLGENFIPYQTAAIEKALSSGIVWNIAGKRAAQNLGHLYYSLRRIDLQKKNFANSIPSKSWHVQWCSALGLNKKIPFHHWIYEYWMWLHFRLWFLYMDLALSSPKRVIQHDDLENIKRIIGDREWNRLHRSLRKTRNR